MKWNYIKNDESSPLNKCLDCDLVSLDWAEKQDDEDTDDFGCNNIYCPRCQSSLYFIASEKEIKEAVA